VTEITEGDAFLVFPGIQHSYRPDPAVGWDEYWVGFRGKYPETLTKNSFLSPQTPVLHPGLHETLIDSLHEIFEIARREPPHFQLKLGGAIIKLIARILSHSEQEKQGSEVADLVEKARVLLDEHIYNHLEMNDFARQLNLEYAELRRLFKSYTGMSPYQYFLHLKINKAKDLLAQGEYSVKEIAYMLSFENQYYFSRLFKSKTGVPPSQWHR
jgi:AraC-like DNA-binding protein